MNKIFRMLSLFLMLIVFLGCLQGITFAVEPFQISIPTLSDGVVFEEGTSIPLSVSHNSDPTTISHIDFYANDAKLPGAILSGDQSKILMWNNPAAGEYKVYARVHYVGDGLCDSEKVTILVQSKNDASTQAEPMTATPEIPNGQRNVSYILPAYRINFNHSLAHFLTEDKLAGITMKTGSKFVELDYEIGVDYLALKPKENLEVAKTYLVAIPSNTLCDAFGNKVPEQSFSFSTTNLANRATPIPTVCYPANGDAVALSGIALAAKVLFPPENAENVTLYDNGKKIEGTVTKGTDGEFILDNVSLSSGEHSISVSVLKNGVEVVSEPITLTATPGTYDVLGVQNGDRIILNPQVEGYTDFQHKVTIVDSDQVTTQMATGQMMTAEDGFTFEPRATGIRSVVFAIDGNVVATDSDYPYEFALGAAHRGENRVLTATINKVGGGTDVKTITYTGMLGEVHESHSLNYNSGTLDATNSPTFNSSATGTATNENGTLKIGGGNNITSVWLQPDVQTSLMELGDNKLFYVDYDVYKNTNDISIAFRMAQGSSRANIVASSATIGTMLPVNRWTHITIVADFQRGWLSAYMDGVQFKSWSQATMTSSTSALVTDNFVPGLGDGSDRALYVDNYTVRTYDTIADQNYEVVGISKDETVYANEKGYQLQVALSAEENATVDLQKAVFSVNGQELASMTEAPFAATLPLSRLGVQNLTVEITDQYDTKQTITIPFTVQFRSGGVVSQKLIADAQMPADKAAVANPGEATSYVLYEAVYTADGMIKYVIRKTVDIAANEIQIHTAESTLENGEKVKLFTWTKELQPLY